MVCEVKLSVGRWAATRDILVCVFWCPCCQDSHWLLLVTAGAQSMLPFLLNFPSCLFRFWAGFFAPVWKGGPPYKHLSRTQYTVHLHLRAWVTARSSDFLECVVLSSGLQRLCSEENGYWYATWVPVFALPLINCVILGILASRSSSFLFFK